MIHVLVAAARSIRNAAAPTHSNKMMIQRLSLQCGSLFFFEGNCITIYLSYLTNN